MLVGHHFHAVFDRVRARHGGDDPGHDLAHRRFTRALALQRQAAGVIALRDDLDQLVCLERTRATQPRLRVIVNLTTPHIPRELEERAISLAASILHAADLQGFEIGLSLPGTDLPVLLTRRSHLHRGRVLSALAAVDPVGLLVTGELIPARCTYAVLDALGDFGAMFDGTRALLVAADLAVIPLEVPLSDRGEPTPCLETFIMQGGAEAIPAIAEAGVDVIGGTSGVNAAGEGWRTIQFDDRAIDPQD